MVAGVLVGEMVKLVLSSLPGLLGWSRCLGYEIVLARTKVKLLQSTLIGCFKCVSEMFLRGGVS